VGIATADQDCTAAVTVGAPSETSLVVCSLEEWSTVRRRIRILVDELVAMDPSVRVLYVAPPRDVPFELAHGRLHGLTEPALEQVHLRIHVLRPHKWLPRALGPAADRMIGRQVAAAATGLGLVNPLVWVNDASYGSFAVATGWPTVYDITDDWLLAPRTPRQEARLRADDELLLRHSGAVVVCSPDLVRTRGARRQVDLIPNGVDVELFRTPQPRPAELPASPVAVYVGTLHDERIDIDLVLDLAAARPDLQVALVGPDSLGHESAARLDAAPNVRRLGPQPYERVPGFLQHADVVLVPHLVNPFTESLDPIKAYECVAAGRPTVATPVAGFRDLGAPVVVRNRDGFVDAVSEVLDAAARADRGPGAAGDDPAPVASWRERAEAMQSVMARARVDARHR
jgi:glycosyltransferase involved in cell wall biosynthesis